MNHSLFVDRTKSIYVCIHRSAVDYICENGMCLIGLDIFQSLRNDRGVLDTF